MADLQQKFAGSRVALAGQDENVQKAILRQQLLGGWAAEPSPALVHQLRDQLLLLGRQSVEPCLQQHAHLLQQQRPVCAGPPPPPPTKKKEKKKN